MKLSNAAIYFDRDPLFDGYTGASLYSGQTASFDDSSQDGATNRRRVLSLAPDLAIPARRVVTLYGDRWLVGTGTPDGFQGTAIRRHYSMKRVTDLMALLTAAQALSAAAGTPAYVQKAYFKDSVNALTDAEYDAFWNVFVAPDEPVGKGSFLRDAAGRLYRVRNDYLPVEGLRVCQSDELEETALQSCVFTTGTFNPVTEVASGTTTVNCIVLEASKFYRFRHVSESQVQAGDCMVLAPTSVTPTVGMTFTQGGLRRRVLSVQSEGGAWALHARTV